MDPLAGAARLRLLEDNQSGFAAPLFRCAAFG
jgi:hypothetical protein